MLVSSREARVPPEQGCVVGGGLGAQLSHAPRPYPASSLYLREPLKALDKAPATRPEQPSETASS